LQTTQDSIPKPQNIAAQTDNSVGRMNNEEVTAAATSQKETIIIEEEEFATTMCTKQP
jgi:hypothetical protein